MGYKSIIKQITKPEIILCLVVVMILVSCMNIQRIKSNFRDVNNRESFFDEVANTKADNKTKIDELKNYYDAVIKKNDSENSILITHTEFTYYVKELLPALINIYIVNFDKNKLVKNDNDKLNAIPDPNRETDYYKLIKPKIQNLLNMKNAISGIKGKLTTISNDSKDQTIKTAAVNELKFLKDIINDKTIAELETAFNDAKKEVDNETNNQKTKIIELHDKISGNDAGSIEKVLDNVDNYIKHVLKTYLIDEKMEDNVGADKPLGNITLGEFAVGDKFETQFNELYKEGLVSKDDFPDDDDDTSLDKVMTIKSGLNLRNLLEKLLLLVNTYEDLNNNYNIYSNSLIDKTNRDSQRNIKRNIVKNSLINLKQYLADYSIVSTENKKANLNVYGNDGLVTRFQQLIQLMKSRKTKIENKIKSDEAGEGQEPSATSEESEETTTTTTSATTTTKPVGGTMSKNQLAADIVANAKAGTKIYLNNQGLISGQEEKSGKLGYSGVGINKNYRLPGTQINQTDFTGSTNVFAPVFNMDKSIGDKEAFLDEKNPYDGDDYYYY
tara:strand:+ start:482 stop:2149 length:1668 start_codon:yes stop_codon:yes gene_type:complete